MDCKLSVDQIEKLYKYVHGEVVAAINSGGVFNPKAAMQKLYDAVYSNNGNDHAGALDYVQHIPELLLISYANFPEVKEHFRNNGIKIQELDDLDAHFKKDPANVDKYMSRKSIVNDPKKLSEDTHPTSATASNVYDEIEEKDKEFKEKLVDFVAKPESALAVWMQEAKDYDGLTDKDNVKDPDPLKQTYYKVVRRINDMLEKSGLKNADKLNYDGVEGIYLTLMRTSNVPFELLYESTKRYYLAPHKNEATNDRKMEEYRTKDQLLVYTDKEGNILYFDSEGRITSKEKGGTIAYGTMRRVQNDGRNRSVYNVQRPELLFKRGVVKSLEYGHRLRNREMDYLETARDYVMKDPANKVSFSVERGRDGFVKEDFRVKNKISELKIPGGFKPEVELTDGREAEGRYKGGVYFNVPGYPYSILLLRPSFSEVPDLLDGLTEYVFDDTKDVFLRGKMLGQFLSNRTAALQKDLADNDVLVTVTYEYDPKQDITIANEKTLELSDPSSKQAFREYLSKQDININLKLLNQSIEYPTLTDGKPSVTAMDYNSFLGKNFYTHLAKNKENEIIQLNAYNHIFPNMQVQNILFPKGAAVENAPGTNVKVETSTPSDQKLENLKQLLKDKSFRFKKGITLDSEALESQMAEAKKWYDESPLSKYVSYEVMFNIVNSDALAEFTLSGITLFKGSNYTDLYHEGWHVFSQMFLTLDQKKRFYGEARKLIGDFEHFNEDTQTKERIKFSEATDFQLEEFFAEDFRKYGLSNGKNAINGRPIRNSIFRRIWNALKLLFQGHSVKNVINDFFASGVVTELYNKLFIGQLNEYAPHINNVQFKMLNKGIEALNESGDSLGYQDSTTINESIDALMASTLASLNLNVGAMFVRPDIIPFFYDYVYSELSNIRSRIPVPKGYEKTTDSIASVVDPKDFKGVSGKADGADKKFGEIAKSLGVEFQDFVPADLSKLTLEEYQEAVDAYKEAQESLKRKFKDPGPHKSNKQEHYQGRLMVRDYLQVKNADAIYAVSDILLPNEFGKINSYGRRYQNESGKQVVDGGTGYAVEMAIKLGKPVYVFHQGRISDSKVEIGWYQWNGNVFEKMTTAPVLVNRFAGVGSRELNETGGKAIADLYTRTFNPGASEIEYSNEDVQSARILDFALANWGSVNDAVFGNQNKGVIAYHISRSKYISFDERFKDMISEEKNEVLDTKEETEGDSEESGSGYKATDEDLREQFGESIFEKKGNERSMLENSSMETVYLIKSLPSIDAKGKIELNRFGIPKLADFSRTWGVIINAVEGSVDEIDMYNKLVKASVYHPQLKPLVEDMVINGREEKARLGNPIEKWLLKYVVYDYENKDMLAAKDTKEEAVEFAKRYTEKTGKSTYIEMEKILQKGRSSDDWPFMKMWLQFYRDMSFYRIPIMEGRVIERQSFIDSNARTALKDFRFEFSESSPQFKPVQKVFQQSFVDDVANQYITANEQGKSLNLSKIASEFKAEKLFLNKEIKDADAILKFFRAVGFYFTDNLQIKNALSERKQLVFYFHKYIMDLASKNAKITNPIKTFLNSNESGRTRELLDIEAKYSGLYSNNSVRNVNGNNEYDLSLHNTITRIFTELNDPKSNYTVTQKNHLNHLNFKRNPHAKYSIMLRSMFVIPEGQYEESSANERRTLPNKKEQVAIQIVNLNGIKKVVEKEGPQVSEDGVKTNELDPGSKFLMDFHSMLSIGVMELPRHAGKSMSYGIRVSNIYSPYNNENTRHLYISTGRFENWANVLNDATELLLPKIAAELERIAIFKSGNIENIPVFRDQAGTFTAFDDILSDKKFNDELIEKANPENSLNMLQAPEIKSRIRNQLEVYFNKLLDENREVLKSMDFVSMDILKSTDTKKRYSVESLVKKDTGKTITDINELKEIALRSFTVNSFIHNLETSAIIYGDLAFYNHNKEEFSKRDASFGSTGRIFGTGPAFLSFINNVLVESPTYAKSIGAKDRVYDGSLKTAVFKDNNIRSFYYDEYLEALTPKYGVEKAKQILEPYATMNEGDAQGWITFDTYRILSVLESQWSDKQNEIYNKIVQGIEVDPSEITEFFPAKKFQYAGPVRTQSLYAPALHKFSLMPLVPTVIKGTNLETLHNNLVRQGIDYAVFESGSKLATVTRNGVPDSIYENDDYTNRRVKPWTEGGNDKGYMVNEIYMHYLKDQVDVSSHWKSKTTFSTQLRKLIINDLFKQGIPNNEEFNNMVERFESLLDDYQAFKKKQLLKEAGWVINEETGELNGSLESLMKFIEKELRRLNIPPHNIDFIRKGIDSKVFTDLSYSLNADKIEKLLNSVVVKRLIKQKINGEQLVQASGALMESMLNQNQESRFTNPTDEQIARYGTNGLSTYTRKGLGDKSPTKAMKVKLALKGDFYKLLNLLHLDKKPIGTRERLNEMIRSDKWLNSKPEIATRVDAIYKAAFSQLKSTKGEDKLFILRSELTPELMDQLDANTKKMTGSTYQGIKIIGDFYKHKYLKSSNGSRLDVIVVDNKEDAQKQYGEYVKGKAKQYTGVGEVRAPKTQTHREFITLVGVRIPVQGLNSMEFMEVAEFLPEEAGSIIIPPAEIVAKSGSDFDIDKLTVFMPNIGMKISKKRILKKLSSLQKKHSELDFSLENVEAILEKSDDDDAVSEMNEKEQELYKILMNESLTELDGDNIPYTVDGKSGAAIENKIITIIKDILAHPENFEALIRPNSVDIAKPVADILAEKNIQGYNPYENKTTPNRVKTNKDGTKKRLISPTRVMETRYNLDVLSRNNIGKKTLGIGAVDNSYSSIFKRIGAYLRNTYTHYKKDKNTGQMIPVERKVRILMPHNTVEVDGQKYISLSDIMTGTMQKISEIIGQLMNGWVDVEKDAWIFNLNGNSKAGPVLLFLVEAGVDFKTAAYFISQPLIVEYIKEIYIRSSPFYEAATNDSIPQKNMITYSARAAMIRKYVPRPSYIKDFKYIKGSEIYQLIEDYTTGVEFTEKMLLDNIDNKPAPGKPPSKVAIAGLLHFFELQDMMSKVTNIKLNTNVDTKASKTIFSAAEKIGNIESLDTVDIFSQDVVKRIFTKTPIRSYYIQKFQFDFIKRLMPARANKSVIDFLVDKIKTKDYEFGFAEGEQFISAFHNDLKMYILQNHMKGIDLDTITEYKGKSVSKSLPVERVMNKYGAFVKDDVMYIDVNQIKSDFENIAFAGNGYKELGLAVQPVYTFQMGDRSQNFQEYANFVLEREFLRSNTPVETNESRQRYEERIAKMALENTYNFHYYLKSNNATAARFLKIKELYPDLSRDYLLIEKLTVTDEGIKVDENNNVTVKPNKFKSLRLNIKEDVDVISTMNENLKQLADPTVQKIENKKHNLELSRFFRQLMVSEYLRSGVSKSSDTLGPILDEEVLLRLIEEPAKQFYESESIKDNLDRYYQLFRRNWNRQNNSAMKYKFRNYLNINTTTIEDYPFDYEDIGENNLRFGANIEDKVKMREDGTMVYQELAGPDSAKKLTTHPQHQSKVFVYPTGENSAGMVVAYIMQQQENTVGIPVVKSVREKWKDESYEENIKLIDQALDNIEAKIDNGQTIVFPDNSLTVIKPKNKDPEDVMAGAPRTYSHLVSELYRRFGFTMKGAEKNLGYREEYQKGQPISDKEIDEIINQKHQDSKNCNS